MVDTSSIFLKIYYVVKVNYPIRSQPDLTNKCPEFLGIH